MPCPPPHLFLRPGRAPVRHGGRQRVAECEARLLRSPCGRETRRSSGAGGNVRRLPVQQASSSTRSNFVEGRFSGISSYIYRKRCGKCGPRHWLCPWAAAGTECRARPGRTRQVWWNKPSAHLPFSSFLNKRKSFLIIVYCTSSPIIAFLDVSFLIKIIPAV